MIMFVHLQFDQEARRVMILQIGHFKCYVIFSYSILLCVSQVIRESKYKNIIVQISFIAHRCVVFQDFCLRSLAKYMY